jgi:hypothetical protein
MAGVKTEKSFVHGDFEVKIFSQVEQDGWLIVEVFAWFCYSRDKLLHIGEKERSPENAEENAKKFIDDFIEESASDDWYV